MSTASNTRLRLITQVGQAHVATRVLLDLETNSQPHRPENATEHKTRASLTYTGQVGEHHQSDRSLLVKPGDFHRTALHRSGKWNTPVRPVQARKPQNTKQAYRALNWPKLETTAPGDNNELTQTFTRAKPNRGLHRSDRWEAPVRTVWPELVGMNNTRGSTPLNPTPNLPNRSTDLHKTLGIVGTPHGESIAKILSTKTCQIKRNRRNLTKNSSNPRVPKTPKVIPLTHEFGRGIKGKRTTKGSHIHPPPNPQEQGLANTPRKPPREGSENHHQEQTGTTQLSLEEPRRIIYTYQGGSYKV
jgi:hypothetical protein